MCTMMNNLFDSSQLHIHIAHWTELYVSRRSIAIAGFPRLSHIYIYILPPVHINVTKTNKLFVLFDSQTHRWGAFIVTNMYTCITQTGWLAGRPVGRSHSMRARTLTPRQFECAHKWTKYTVYIIYTLSQLSASVYECSCVHRAACTRVTLCAPYNFDRPECVCVCVWYAAHAVECHTHLA